jgi:hypothetical protein
MDNHINNHYPSQPPTILPCLQLQPFYLIILFLFHLFLSCRLDSIQNVRTKNYFSIFLFFFFSWNFKTVNKQVAGAGRGRQE